MRTEAKGKVKMPIEPGRKVRKALKRTGKARVKARVTFTPDGGKANTQTKPLRLVVR